MSIYFLLMLFSFVPEFAQSAPAKLYRCRYSTMDGGAESWVSEQDARDRLKIQGEILCKGSESPLVSKIYCKLPSVVTCTSDYVGIGGGTRGFAPGNLEEVEMVPLESEPENEENEPSSS